MFIVIIENNPSSGGVSLIAPRSQIADEQVLSLGACDIAVSPKATNLIAGGNATGFERHLFSTLKASNCPCSVTGGVATGY
jgi:hypothetical protein